MHVFEGGQPFDHGFPEDFEGTPRVRNPIVHHPIANPIGNSGRPSTHKIIMPGLGHFDLAQIR